jgi:hypothetical protein
MRPIDEVQCESGAHAWGYRDALDSEHHENPEQHVQESHAQQHCPSWSFGLRGFDGEAGGVMARVH